MALVKVGSWRWEKANRGCLLLGLVWQGGLRGHGGSSRSDTSCKTVLGSCNRRQTGQDNSGDPGSREVTDSQDDPSSGKELGCGT